MSLGKISILVLALTSISTAQGPNTYKVNLDHLLSLVQRIELKGEEVSVVDIYSDYPTYNPVVAKGEGFACVDDAARAAVLLIRYDQVFHTNANREVIDGLVKFVIAMQTNNGCFYNFVMGNGREATINTTGRTSYSSFGWWAARAVWALGEAAEYYRKIDIPRFNAVVEAINRSMPRVDSVLQNYRNLTSTGEPTWLLYNDGADASSELVLGLNAAYRATGKKAYLEAAGKLCNGMLFLQQGNSRQPPYGMFASNSGGWHGWANSQSAAIMQYSKLSGDTTMFKRAVQEVNCFLPRWAGSGFFRSCNLHGDSTDYSDQIAYGIQPSVSAAVEAYEMTHENKYKALACILASWFFGNNTARSTFYIVSTGVCFDGTVDSLHLNKNSGAESTVEALLSMVDLNSIGTSFHKISLISSKSFNTTEYRYDFDGSLLVIKMVSGGFQAIFTSWPRKHNGRVLQP